jgi:hypothetical protein
MRLHRGVPVLAAVLSLAGTSAPVAYGFENLGPSDGGQVTPVRVQQGSSGSNDWLIAAGAAGGLTVIGAGAAAKRRHSQRHRRAVTTA